MPQPDQYSPIKGLREEEVIEALLQRFNIAREWLMERSRKSRERTYIRQLGLLIIRRHVRNTSLTGLAELFNRADHTSVIYSLHEARKRLKDNPDFKKDYERMVAELMNSKDVRTGPLSKGHTLINQRLAFMQNSIWWLHQYAKGEADWKDASTAITNLLNNCEEVKSELHNLAIKHF